MSNRRKLPLISFGAFEDFSLWAVNGTPIVTSGQTDPFGGTGAYLLNDDDGAGNESVEDPFTSATLIKDKFRFLMAVFVKQGTATTNALRLIDAFGVTSLFARINWTGGVPAWQIIEGATLGFVYPFVDLGGGWWLARIERTDKDGGGPMVNPLTMRIQPAGDIAADTGTMLVYGRSVIVFGHPLDGANAWDDPREGTAHVMSPDGSEDARTAGDDHLLEGAARWIPNLDRGSPHNLTGWDGRRDHAMVNVGWSSFLRFGYTSDPFVFAPNQSVVATNTSVILAEPRDPESLAPSLESDITKVVSLVLRDASDVPFKGY